MLAAILLAGFLLRIANLCWGIPISPYSGFYHPDEMKSWSSTVGFPENYFTSTNFLYGTAIQYYVGLLLLPLKFLLVHLLSATDEYVLAAIVVFRLVSVVMGTASVLVTWHLGRLIHSDRAGLIAAALLSVAFTPALNSALTTLDVAMSLLTLAALLQLFRALQTLRAASFAGLGAVCGQLLATKITGGLILAVVAGWLAWRLFLYPDADQRATPISRRFQFLALVLLVALAVFAVTTPHVILRLPEYLQFMQSQKAQWYDQSNGSLAAIGESWCWATSICLGTPTCLLALGGIAVGRAIKWDHLIPLIACIVANYLFWMATLQPRFVLPIAPLLCLFAAVACDKLLTAKSPLVKTPGRLALAIALLWSLTWTTLGIAQKAADPRTSAARFIAQQLPAGTSIGTATDHGEQWQHHAWRYPVIDFQRYRDIYFVDRPDYIVVTALELNSMRPALASPQLLAGDRWDPASSAQWYLHQPPPPEVFAFYRDLFAGTHYTLRASFASPVNLRFDGACPAVYLYERKPQVSKSPLAREAAFGTLRSPSSAGQRACAPSPAKRSRIVNRPSSIAVATIALLAASGCRMVSTGRNVDGVRYFQQGQYPVALQRFDAAMTIDPRNPDTYYNKAAVLHRTGLANRDQNSLTQAESFYQQCLALDPNHVDCHRGLAVLLTETGRKDQAFTLLKNWTVQSPTNADAQVELARLYEEYSDPRSAEQALNAALAIDLRNWRAHAALGRLREQSGDYVQALQNYQMAYSLNRFQPDLQRQIAALQARVGPTPAGASTLANPIAATRSASTAAVPFRRY